MRQIVHAHKGALWLSLRTHGKSVHASAPDQGVNAIYKMADVLRCIRDEVAPALARQFDPVLGAPTISAGTICGGTKTNIVPDRVRSGDGCADHPGAGPGGNHRPAEERPVRTWKFPAGRPRR